jgi:putative protein-disulfide isomerase
MSRELLYVADPMCSWCWGFAPVIRSIVGHIDGRAAITPIMGGLRPLTRTPMDDDMKTQIKHHWESVETRSGQPFDMSFFDRSEFIYDTEPACRAVGIVRRLVPAKTLNYLEAVQRGFYNENQDVTDGDVLRRMAEALDIDGDTFGYQFDDVASAYETAGDFQVARQLGVTGYPTVITKSVNDYALLSAGYQPFESLVVALDEWLSDHKSVVQE